MKMVPGTISVPRAGARVPAREIVPGTIFEETHPGTVFSHLDWLESEAVHIMRETVAETRNPALLFSGGKDSIVMLRIAEKAFRPDRFPFPLLHVDTEHNFPEVIAFRDRRAMSSASDSWCAPWAIRSAPGA
jgi:hypothetical protein